MSSYKVYSQPLGDFATNAYLIVHNQNAIAIDAPPGASEFFKKICDSHNLNLKFLLLTHSHFDHIADASMIQESGVKVGIHKLDEGNCKKPGSDRLPLMMNVGPFNPDFFLDEGECSLEGFPLKIIHTPGHTPGGICILCQEHLFSGDTLFKGAIGNLSFATAEPDKMKKSLEKLYHLQPDYIVYPGHGPKTRLDSERSFIKLMIEHIG
jgi:hydroxyacylglutathione hydrolase